MWMFTLAISCLTTSNFPWFMDLPFQVPMQYCSTASDFTSIINHIHSWVLFLLWLHPFILSGVISPLISSSILGTYWPGEFIFQCPIFFHFHTVHGVLGCHVGPPKMDGLWWRILTKMWSTGEGNGKPLQYSCLENPKNPPNLASSFQIMIASNSG